MNPAEGQLFVQLIDDLRAMPEKAVLRKIDQLYTTIEIFHGNYQELIHHIRKHNDPAFAFALTGNRRTLMDSYRMEITRYLHNFAASASTLIDHTRIQYRDLYNIETFPEYQDRVDATFSKNPLARFFKELRNYLQHFKLPDLLTSTTIIPRENHVSVTLMISKSALLEYSGWNAYARKFLESIEKDLDVERLVEDYHPMVKEFYSWFLDRQNEIHKPERLAVHEQQNKIRQLQIGGFIYDLANAQFAPKSVREFESYLQEYFSDEELMPVHTANTTAEKIERIVVLLGKFSKLEKSQKDAIAALYRS